MYGFWYPIDHKIIVSWEVNFNETITQRKEVQKTPKIVPNELKMSKDKNENEYYYKFEEQQV